MFEKYKSKCCNAKVKTGGMPDFLESKEICTVYFVCRKCENPCDIKSLNLKNEKTSGKKLKYTEFNINDYIMIRLTQKGNAVHQAYCKKYRHDPIAKTANGWSRVILWEFMRIFGPSMIMGQPNVIVDNLIKIPRS